MEPQDTTSLARVRIHPAVLVLGALGLAALERGLWPHTDVPPTAVLHLAGRILMAAGAVMLIVAYATVLRAGTTIDPRTPSAALVSTGIYRLSRNPIYLGWFLFFLGGGLSRGSLFDVGVAVVMIGLLHWAVVLPEEAYLERRFGDAYRQYRRSVRRWI